MNIRGPGCLTTIAAALALALGPSCTPAVVDRVPETQVEHRSADSASSVSAQGDHVSPEAFGTGSMSAMGPSSSSSPSSSPANPYLHLLQVGPVALGLADVRGMPLQDGLRATEQLGQALAQCAWRMQSEGRLVEGAARVALRVSAQGTVDGARLTPPEGAGALAVALLCFVSPAKQLNFAPAPQASADRGLAFEALWAPKVLRSLSVAADGGSP